MDKAAFRSAPSIFPSFEPTIPKLNAVVPPSTSLTVKEFVITELVSVMVIPLPELFIEAVKFEEALLIAEIIFNNVVSDVTSIVVLFPALSVTEKEPVVIPAPPFYLETLVVMFKLGFKSAPKTSDPGIVTFTLVPSSI